MGQALHQTHRRATAATPTPPRTGESILRILAACYLQGDAKGARRCLLKYRDEISYDNEAIGLLVREGEINEAAQMVRTRWDDMRKPDVDSNAPACVYDERIEQNLPGLVKRLGVQLGYVAEIAVASLPDPPDEDHREGRPDRDARLAALADRYGGIDGLKSQDMKVKALLMLSRGKEIAKIAEPLREQVGKLDLAVAGRGRRAGV